MRKNEVMKNYFHYRREVYENLLPEHLQNSMVSERNWMERWNLSSSADLGITVRLGDICYTDFGQGYLYECAYQHFGLVVAIYGNKALLVPMTSNEQQYQNAYDAKENPGGRRHLMRIGKIPGLSKASVLFLNDMRFINTARVIDVMGRIDPSTDLFIEVQERILQILMSDGRITTCLKRTKGKDI